MRIWLLALVAASSLLGQQHGDPWEPLRFPAGKWEGKTAGQPGKGVTNREHAFELRGRALSGRNRAVYEPKPGETEPEVHEDWNIFAYDRAARQFVLRQFHVEGFVNEYTCSVVASAEPRRVECVTRRIENIPEGWRAREVYTIHSPDEFTEVFSLAGPGKEFETYSEARFRRVR